MLSSNQNIYDSYFRKITDAHIWQGILYPGDLFKPEVLNDIKYFKVRSDDIFISTYPKSGTTWTAELVSVINSQANLEWAKSLDISERVLHLEAPPNLCLQQLDSLPSPRIFETHLPYHLLPDDIRQGIGKVIYVMRNPKDVAVSFYHHHRMVNDLGNFDGTFSDFLMLFSEGKTVGGSWFDHVLGYWEQKEREILILKYEDMKKNLREIVVQLSSYLEVVLSAPQVDDVCHHCSFDVMRKNEKANRDWIPLFDKSKSNFMRKGVVGDWKNYFDLDEDRSFMSLYRSRMSRSPSLSFEFEGKGYKGDVETQAIERPIHEQTNSVEHSNLHWNNSANVYEHLLPSQTLAPS